MAVVRLGGLPGPDEALCGADPILLHLDPVQAAQVRRLAVAWGLTPEQAIAGLLSHHLGQYAAAVVDLVPSTRGLQ